MPAGLGSIHEAQVRTTDGVIGTSGEGSVVFSIALRGGSGGAGTAIVYDGTSGSGTAKANLSAVQDDTVVFDCGPHGVNYPNGIYVDIGGTGAAVTVVYNQD